MRLPVVVIGGGLTAIDTATESLAYYPIQVEKFLARYETLAAERSEEAVRAEWNNAEREVAIEFIAHARAIRAERETARREGRAPRLVELLDSWGGVTIAYRRRLVDSPSYTLNHEEVAKAMGLSVSAVRCHLARGRNRLRTAMEADQPRSLFALHPAKQSPSPVSPPVSDSVPTSLVPATAD